MCYVGKLDYSGPLWIKTIQERAQILINAVMFHIIKMYIEYMTLQYLSYEPGYDFYQISALTHWVLKKMVAFLQMR